MSETATRYFGCGKMARYRSVNGDEVRWHSPDHPDGAVVDSPTADTLLEHASDPLSRWKEITTAQVEAIRKDWVQP